MNHVRENVTDLTLDVVTVAIEKLQDSLDEARIVKYLLNLNYFKRILVVLFLQ